MVSNGEKCLYLTVKTSAHVGGFYCFNCFYLSSFVKIIRESLKNVRQKKKKKKSGIAMLPEDTNLLQFNQYRKSDHTQSIIYVDLDSSIKRIDGFKYGAEKISTAKVGKHISGGYSIKHWTSIRSFDGIEKVFTEVKTGWKYSVNFKETRDEDN